MGRRCLLEPIQAVKGREVGYTLNRSPTYYRTNTHRQTIHTCTYSQFRLINSLNKHVFRLWEETRMSRENSDVQRENMQSPQRKAGADIQNHDPLHPHATLSYLSSPINKSRTTFHVFFFFFKFFPSSAPETFRLRNVKSYKISYQKEIKKGKKGLRVLS